MEPDRVSRRAFLANAVLGIAGVLGLGALSARFLQYLVPPAPPQREVELATVMLETIPDRGGVVVPLPSGHVALQRDGDRVFAHSAVCSHLGCIVQWRPQGRQAWQCPCHKGSYDAQGRVLSGPPPRGLAAVPAAVRDGMVYVRVTVRAREPMA